MNITWTLVQMGETDLRLLQLVGRGFWGFHVMAGTFIVYALWMAMVVLANGEDRFQVCCRYRNFRTNSQLKKPVRSFHPSHSPIFEANSNLSAAESYKIYPWIIFDVHGNA